MSRVVFVTLAATVTDDVDTSSLADDFAAALWSQGWPRLESLYGHSVEHVDCCQHCRTPCPDGPNHRSACPWESCVEAKQTPRREVAASYAPGRP